MDERDGVEKVAMRVAVIYDFAANLGGGDFVMLNILEAIHDAGYEVTLLTSYPEGLQFSARFFGKTIPNVNMYSVKVPRFLKHPYSIAYIAYIAHQATKTLRDLFDIYITSDDVPIFIADRRGVCYTHYPHAARLKLKKYIARRYRYTLRGKLIWKIHEFMFPRLYIIDKKPRSWLLLANSIITREHLAKTFQVSNEEIILLNPPVASRVINEMLRKSSLEKENLIVSVGRFESEKRFVDVLYAMRWLKEKIGDIKLSLIGFKREEMKLFKIIKNFGLEKNVEILINADRKILLDRLLRAKAIIHPAPHEPFGIAIVEGMAAGCIPIVRRSSNGPWLEIIAKGEYGIGFSNLHELVKAVEKAVKSYEVFDMNRIISRALEYDESIFKQRFIDIIRSFLVNERFRSDQ
jgi:glycosyltransferase involved in cell wall biosynthesis